MNIHSLAEVIGSMEGVSVLAATSSNNDPCVRFMIDQADTGWWSFELLCSLEQKYSTQIVAHAGPTAGAVIFVLSVPEKSIENVLADVNQLVSAA